MNVPVATYRLQLTPSFGFREASEIMRYLRDLGISHVYLAPIFEACHGSQHGYDQTDPTRLREELGADEGFAVLAREVGKNGLRILLDIVPNHVAAHHANPWWWEMLRDGRDSATAAFFDVDWESGDNRIVLPVLGAPLDAEITNGRLRIELGDCPRVRYDDQLFPIHPSTWSGRSELSHDEIRALLHAQHYRLCEWKSEHDAINYRRFFDINGLAAIRVEEPLVFDAMHEAVLRLVGEGRIHGLRIDHIDGLRDPLAYLRRLRSSLDALGPRGTDAFILVEKILGSDEAMPDEWPVDGTTGYEFAALATALGVDHQGLNEIRAHADAQGLTTAYDSILTHAKTEIARSHFTPELDRLMRAIQTAAAIADISIDWTQCRQALVSLSARLDVYRTYVDHAGPSSRDAERVQRAADLVKGNGVPDLSPGIDFLTTMFLLQPPFDAGPARSAALNAVALWQQLTGPLAAKGGEDTALYRDNTLPALNDVGSDPATLPSADAWRRLFAQREQRPRCLNATSTHDTKRGEDTRYRIAALSHQPQLLQEALESVERMVGNTIGTPAARLLAYTLIAMEPLGEDDCKEDRLREYMRKASREAKLLTQWTTPATDYEAALDSAVDTVMRLPPTTDVRTRLHSAHAATRERAFAHSVLCILLKTLTPGVPDFYQGTEFLDVSLVDPDNRRLVDWNSRRESLDRLRRRAITGRVDLGPSTAELDERKMFATWRALAMRRWLIRDGGHLAISSLDDALPPRRWEVACGTRRMLVSEPDAECSAASGAVDQLSTPDGNLSPSLRVFAFDPEEGGWLGRLIDPVCSLDA